MTYLPAHFEETDPATLHALVGAYPLAIWVVPHQGELLVNHIPFLLDAQRGEHGNWSPFDGVAPPVFSKLVFTSMCWGPWRARRRCAGSARRPGVFVHPVPVD